MVSCRYVNRREFLGTAAAARWTRRSQRDGTLQPPNIILILADDLGYGDLGCYGASIPTPNLDRMASEGIRFSDFSVASPVCSPSRASLLTGRYPARVGITSVLQAADTHGLPNSETTIAATLRTAGYRTMCIGKWHLGSQPQFLPLQHGFDEYFGIPYSNDMWPLPLMRGNDIIEEPANLATLTSRYTDEAVGFVQRSKDAPFFLYLAYQLPHIPLTPSNRFRSASGQGPYADSVIELDWSAGVVLQTLRDAGSDSNTLVIFTSDNGPWYQGSPGRLRGRKGETFEGGMREPFLARLPGTIPAGIQCAGLATALDLHPTLARLACAPLPGNPLDGVDIWPLLTGAQQKLNREPFLYFDGWNLQCARLDHWKLHVSRRNRPPWTPGDVVNLPLQHPELYDLRCDPEESFDCAADHPETVSDIRERMESLLNTFPSAAVTAWQDTMKRQVEYTPSGAWPVEKKS